MDSGPIQFPPAACALETQEARRVDPCMQSFLVVHTDRNRMLITLHLRSGILSEGIVSQFMRALDIGATLSISSIRLRICGAGSCAAMHGMESEVDCIGAMERLGFDVVCPTSEKDDDFVLPYRLAELLSQTKVPIVAMVSGSLLSASVALLAYCHIVVADVNSEISVDGPRRLRWATPDSNEQAVSKFEKRGCMRISATQALSMGWYDGVWKDAAEFVAWETRLSNWAEMHSGQRVSRKSRPLSEVFPWPFQGVSICDMVNGRATLAAPQSEEPTGVSRNGDNKTAGSKSILIRKLAREHTSKSLASMIAQMGFAVDFAYVPSFKVSYSRHKFGFVGFRTVSDACVCQRVVRNCGAGFEAEFSWKFCRSKMLKLLAKASAQPDDPAGLPWVSEWASGLI